MLGSKKMKMHNGIYMVYLGNSISKSFMSLLPSARRTTVLSSPRRLDMIDLEME